MKKKLLLLLIVGIIAFYSVNSPEPYTRVENYYTCNLATVRAKEIVKDFSHDQFRVHTIDHPYNTIGENIAHGYKTKEALYAAWHASPTHNKILNMHWRYSCLRCYKEYCAEEFADEM